MSITKIGDLYHCEYGPPGDRRVAKFLIPPTAITVDASGVTWFHFGVAA